MVGEAASHLLVFEKLASELPPSSLLGRNQDQDEQARAVLSLVADRALQGSAAEQEPRDPKTCPNCGIVVESTRTPYCGDYCKVTAGFVRLFRLCIANGSIFEYDEQVGLGLTLWSLHRGQPHKGRRVPPEIRSAILDRDGHVCKVCQAPATAIGRVRGVCNRARNLRAVCDACNDTPPFVPLSSFTAEEQAHLKRLYEDCAARIAAPEPLRCCDESDDWDFRKYLADRRTER